VAQFLDRAHQGLVARGLESVGRMQAMLPSDEQKNGVAVRQRRLARQLEHRRRTDGHAGLDRGPVAALDPHVLEVDARQVQSHAALLAAACGEVDIDQAPLGDGWPWQGRSVRAASTASVRCTAVPAPEVRFGR
jgi:hypothetical protein